MSDPQKPVLASTGGSNSDAVHEFAATLIRKEPPSSAMVDIGCGRGGLGDLCRGAVRSYMGLDGMAWEAFPKGQKLLVHDLNRVPWPLADGSANIVAALGVVEYLENPASFFRELSRIAAPGALVLVATSNQVSIRSKVSLIFRDRFVAFHTPRNPAAISPLTPEDLLRFSRSSALADGVVHYPDRGRIPGIPIPWPTSGPHFSDNVVLVCRKA